MENPKIVFDHVGKVFKTRKQKIEAVHDYSMKVDEGDFVSIVGPSGCGKSTLIRLLDGIIKPTSGNIFIDGQEVSKGKMKKEFLQKMGFVFQEPNLLPWLNIKDNVALPLKILKLEEDETVSEKRVDDLLKMVGLEKNWDSFPVEVSGGMNQRVGVIRAMVHNPEILLMDEPFGSLDGITQEVLDMELLKIWEESHKTIVFITHSVEEAVLLSKKVYVMATKPGRLVSVENIDLPYPRSLEMVTSEKFNNYTQKITDLIGKLDLKNIK